MAEPRRFWRILISECGVCSRHIELIWSVIINRKPFILPNNCNPLSLQKFASQIFDTENSSISHALADTHMRLHNLLTWFAVDRRKYNRISFCWLRLVIWFLFGCAITFQMSAHKQRYKNVGLDSTEMRRRREEEGIQLRKQKREQQLIKRRNVDNFPTMDSETENTITVSGFLLNCINSRIIRQNLHFHCAWIGCECRFAMPRNHQ